MPPHEPGSCRLSSDVQDASGERSTILGQGFWRVKHRTVRRTVLRQDQTPPAGVLAVEAWLYRLAHSTARPGIAVTLLGTPTVLYRGGYPERASLRRRRHKTRS